MLSIHHGRKKNEEIRSAAKLGLVQVIEWFKETDEEIIFTLDEHQKTLLHCAAEGGSLPAFLWLLKQGLDIKQTDLNQVTWLHKAVEENQFRFIQKLEEYVHEFICTPDINGMTPLLYAAEGGHYTIFFWLLEKGADLRERDVHGKTALLFAAEGGHSSIIARLLDMGVKISEEDGEGRTLLHFLAKEGYLGLIKRYENLFKSHNVLTRRDYDGRTAQDYATQGGHLKILQWLMDHNPEFNKSDLDDCLLMASEEGHLEIIQWIASQFTSLLVFDEKNRTILHLAAQKGHLNVVNWLFELPKEQTNSLINLIDIEKKTALHIAVKEGHLDIIKKLLSSGVPSTQLDGDLRTILHIAAHEGQLAVVEWLLNYWGQTRFAIIDYVDIHGNTALHSATEEGYLGIVELLLEQGALAADENAEGKTILHISVCKGYFDIVEWLLEAKFGAYVNKEDNLHFSALDYAVEGGSYRIVKALIESPAFNLHELNIQEVMSYFFDAARKGNLTVLQLFLVHLGERYSYKLVALDDAEDYSDEESHRDRTNYLRVICHEDLVTLDYVEDYSDEERQLDRINYIKVICQGDSKKQTVFHQAAEANQPHIVEFLIHHLSLVAEISTEKMGEEVIKRTDRQGKTPLHCAAEKSAETAAFLLSLYPASAGIPDFQGKYPIHYAVIGNQFTIACQLSFIYPESVLKKDVLWMTALHLAAQKGFLNVAQFLIARKANLSAKTLDGRSLIEIASSAGSLAANRETLQFLYYEHMRQELQVSIPFRLRIPFQKEKEEEIFYHTQFINLTLGLGLMAKISLLIVQYQREKLFLFLDTTELSALYPDEAVQYEAPFLPATTRSPSKLKISDCLRVTVFGRSPFKSLLEPPSNLYEPLYQPSSPGSKHS